MQEKHKFHLMLFFNIIFGTIALVEVYFYRIAGMMIGFAVMLFDSPNSHSSLKSFLYYAVALLIITYPITYVSCLSGSFHQYRKNNFNKAVKWSYAPFYHLILTLIAGLMFLYF